MKYITFLNITAKLIFTVSIFVFVHEVSDYIYVPLINSLGFFASGILAIWIVVKDFNVQICIPKLATLVGYLRDSSQFFLSRVSVSIYTSTNAFILGLFTNNKMVGYYSIAEKLYIALQQIYHPLVNTLYPYVAHRKNVHLYKKIFKLITFANVILVLALFVSSDQIIRVIFGDGLEVSMTVFKMLLLSSIIVVPSILLGYPFLAAMGYPKYANMSVVVGSFLHLLGIGILSVLHLISVYSVALMVVITESFVLAIRLYGVIKEKLWRVK
jgi:PST family polysaccharide transporter